MFKLAKDKHEKALTTVPISKNGDEKQEAILSNTRMKENTNVQTLNQFIDEEMEQYVHKLYMHDGMTPMTLSM